MKTNFKILPFTICRFFAALGDQFMMFAVPLVILKITGSVAYSGLAFAIEWAPRLIFFPVAGSIADRFNIKKLFVVADLSRAMAIVLCGFLVFRAPDLSFWTLSLMMGFLSIMNSIAFIGMEATLPRRMSLADLPKAQSILQGTDQISQVLGPALAAFAAGFLPLEWVLFAGAAFFAISFVNALTLPSTPAQPTEKRSPIQIALESYSVGWQVLSKRKILFQLCALTWIVNLIYGTILVVAPAVTIQTFLKSNQAFGILQTSASVFAILIFFFVPTISRRLGLPMIGAIALSMMCAGGLVAALGTQFWIFSIGSIVLLGADGLFNVYIRSLRARIIPKEHLGKTTGLIILINNCSLPLSGIAVSFLTTWLNPQQILLTMTVTAIALSAIVLAVGKLLFRYRTTMPNIEIQEAA